MSKPISIRALFKQATVKGGTANLQFEVLTENEGAFPAIKKSGKHVVLTIEDAQQSLDFDEETGEVWQ